MHDSLTSLKVRYSSAALSLLLALTLLAGTICPQPAQAQVSKHHKAVGVAAGVGTYAALKHSAKQKKAEGKKLNFAERHPVVSGAAAGLVTNHMLKKHYKKTHGK